MKKKMIKSDKVALKLNYWVNPIAMGEKNIAFRRFQ